MCVSYVYKALSARRISDSVAHILLCFVITIKYIMFGSNMYNCIMVALSDSITMFSLIVEHLPFVLIRFLFFDLNFKESLTQENKFENLRITQCQILQIPSFKVQVVQFHPVGCLDVKKNAERCTQTPFRYTFSFMKKTIKNLTH